MKNNLTAQRLVTVGATKIGAFSVSPAGVRRVDFDFAKGKTKDDASKSGFYIIVKEGIAIAKTFVGDQETGKGFNDTIYRVKSSFYDFDSGMPKLIHNGVVWRNNTYAVYFLPLTNTSRLLHVQQLELFGENLGKVQSLTSVSRQLFKAYNFEYQKR